MEEKELINKVISGSSAAWKEFEELYSPLLRAAISRTIPQKKSSADFSDAYHEVTDMLTTDNFHALSQYKGEGKFTTFLWTIARRRVEGYLEHLEDFEFIETDTVHSLKSADRQKHGVEERVLSGMVRTALSELGAGQKILVELYYISGLSVKETAKAAGIPEAQLGTAVARIREKLKKAVEEKFKSR